MIIRVKVILLLLLLAPILVNGQGAVGWLNEEKAIDSVSKWSYDDHSAIYPKIRQIADLKIQSKTDFN